MAVNLERIDAELEQVNTELAQLETKRERLKLLREMAGDPSMCVLLEELITSNGHHIMPSSQPITSEHVASTGVYRRGDLMRATHETARLFSQQQFTARTVMERMQSSGFRFDAANPILSVADALRKLAERDQQISLIRRGGGRTPTVYANRF